LSLTAFFAGFFVVAFDVLLIYATARLFFDGIDFFQKFSGRLLATFGLLFLLKQPLICFFALYVLLVPLKQEPVSLFIGGLVSLAFSIAYFVLSSRRFSFSKS